MAKRRCDGNDATMSSKSRTKIPATIPLKAQVRIFTPICITTCLLGHFRGGCGEISSTVYLCDFKRRVFVERTFALDSSAKYVIGTSGQAVPCRTKLYEILSNMGNEVLGASLLVHSGLSDTLKF